MTDAALDNDVVLKGASYRLLAEMLKAVPGGPYTYGVLGAAQYMLPKTLAKKQIAGMADAATELHAVLQGCEVLEPSEVERRLAADLQFSAQQASFSLDAGEAQLTAMVITRKLKLFLTGDKRAIAALGSVPFPAGLSRAYLAHRLVCFEQAIWALCEVLGAQAVRKAVCAESGVDAQMRICFSCSSPEVTEESWREGIRSAIEHARAQAPDLLSTI